MAYKIIRSSNASAIADVNERSVNAKNGIRIFELGDLSGVTSRAKAESIRRKLVAAHVSIRQLTNATNMHAWTKVAGLESLMQMRHVDPGLCRITNEILIFDSTVAIYRVALSVDYLEVQDESYAAMMRDIFDTVWSSARPMRVGEGGAAEIMQ